MSSSTINWKVTNRPSTAAQFFCERHRRRKLAIALTTPPSIEPAAASIIDAERLIAVFHDLKTNGGKAAGPNGFTYWHLSNSEAANILRTFAKALEASNYQPGPGLTVRVPKPSGGTRNITMRDLEFRVLAASLNKALSPFWERIFLPGSFGFRPGASPFGLLASLEATMVARNLRVLAIDDVRAAFDNVEIDRLMNFHRLHLHSQELLGLIELVIRGGEKRTIGIDQGSAYSPAALNLYLHHLHDKYVPLYSKSSAWFRYADNLVYPVPSVLEGQQVLAKATELLQLGGLVLKGQDGPPVDLREGSVQLLGFTLTWDTDRLKFGLGDGAWTKLSQNLLKAHEAADPQATAEKVVEGWLASIGPAFTKTEAPAIQAQLQKTLAEAGFRESIDPLKINQHGKKSRRLWLTSRQTVAGALAVPPVGV